MHLSPEHLDGFARLHRLPDGQILLKVLRAKLEETDMKLRKLSGEELLRAQGRAVCLEELIEDICDSATRLNRPSTSRRAFVNG